MAPLYFRGFSKPYSRVQLFLFLNDLAGRWPLLDGAARFFYIGALPALGTLLLAQLLILPRSGTGVSRSKTALTLLLALMLGALVAWGFDLVASWLHLGNLSPRPWMTRRVNWLVVEPQDDSFPCVELVLAAAVACASWKLNFRWGIVSWAGVVLLALTRLFCGNNYLADVVVGMAVGASSFVLCSQLCQRHRAFGQRAREFSLSASPLAVTLVGCYFFALLSPRFEGKLGIGRPASAATSPAAVGATSTAATTVAQGEGEGMEDDEGRAEELALAKRSALFLPAVEAFLRGKLTALARPYTLLDVEVAPVKAGTTSYRCAAIRFEVPAMQPGQRRVIADRAAQMVRTAFASDSQLENVDVIAVARDQGRNLDNSEMVFAGDEVPVFTASIQRKNLGVPAPTPVPTTPAAKKGAPTPVKIDGLSWLRSRSLLYINERALPASPAPARQPAAPTAPNVNTTPLPTATPSGTAAPQKTPIPRTNVTPSIAPKASASPYPLPTTHPQGGLPRVAPSPKAQPQRPAQTSTPMRTSVAPTGRPTSQSTGAHATPTPKPTQSVTPATAQRTSRPTPTRTGQGASTRP